MKSPGATYRKLKEVKYRHLVTMYEKYLRRVPENCKYNYVYTFVGDGGNQKAMRLCLLHQEGIDMSAGVFPHLIDVCEEPRHSNVCNGFVFKYTKDDIKNILEAEFNNRKMKEKKYPDVCALEWALEKSVVGIPPFSWIQNLYYFLKRKLIKSIL